MLMPPISRYMTRQLWTIERGATLTDAHQLMRAHAIRHLPVMDNGQLVGLISIGDVVKDIIPRQFPCFIHAYADAFLLQVTCSEISGPPGL